MRMTNGNCRDAAQRFHGVYRRVVNQAEAIPQHVAAGRLHQERALTNRERGFGANAGEIWFLRFDEIVMIPLQLFKRRPLLPVLVDVLPLVFTNEAVRWRMVCGGILHAAGDADVMGHD
jgi:hypothetical protein